MHLIYIPKTASVKSPLSDSIGSRLKKSTKFDSSQCIEIKVNFVFRKLSLNAYFSFDYLLSIKQINYNI